MMKPEPKPSNERQLAHARAALEKLLCTTVQTGFYGEVGVTISVQDGVIQHIRCKYEQLSK